jgi:hypothetical protein
MTTWTVGQLVTAALMNSNIQALGAFVLAPPLASVYASTAQSVANNSWTALLMDTNILDSDSGHSVTTNTSRYVIQVAGTYLVFGQSSWAASTAGGRGAGCAKNGTLNYNFHTEAPANASALSTVLPYMGLVACNVGDYMETWGWQNTGSALSTVAGWSSLSVLRVSN